MKDRDARGKAWRRHAFTMIELLVVMAIIGILAALLFPAVQVARQSALAGACGSNMRQCGMAIAMYVNDHDGYLPPNHSPSWYGSNPQYAGVAPWSAMLYAPRGNYLEPDVCACPAQLREQGGRYQWGHGYGSFLRDFSFRLDNYFYRFDGWPNSPSRVMLAIDTVRGSEGADYDLRLDWQIFCSEARHWYTGVHARHNRRANVLFADGHVGSLSKAQLLERPGGNWTYGVFPNPPVGDFIFER